MPRNLPACAARSGPQGRRKNDPFSPQARWGDDGARQVKTVLAGLCSTPTPRFVARCFPRHASAPLRLCKYWRSVSS